LKYGKISQGKDNLIWEKCAGAKPKKLKRRGVLRKFLFGWGVYGLGGRKKVGKRGTYSFVKPKRDFPNRGENHSVQGNHWYKGASGEKKALLSYFLYWTPTCTK